VPSNEAKLAAARKAGNMVPKRRPAKKKRMEYKAPSTSTEQRKRRSDAAGAEARTRTPKAQVLDARKKAAGTVSKVQGYMKMMGMSSKKK